MTRLVKKLLTSTLLSLTAASGMVASVQAAESDDSEQPRWFEIEVILVQQLQSQYASNEQFDTDIVKPYHGQRIDLIEPYLYELKNYQHALPECTSKEPNQARASDKAYLLEASNGATLKDAEIKSLNVELGCKPRQAPELFDQLTEGDLSGLAYIPTTIEGRPQGDSEQAYLLQQDALQLGHIYRSLARSKHFRPLMHIGWRQPVLGKDQALPVKLMAGDNINYQYAAQAQAINALMLEQKVQQVNTSLANEEQIQANLQRIITLLQSADDNIDVEPILATLKQQQQSIEKQQKAQKLAQIVERPAQDWFIEGFFKVHLDHYLFINGDFNVYRPLTEDIIKAAQKNNTAAIDNIVTSIPFKQNRRVISGELHYFDHPFMGMVVQIRRFEKEDSEQVDYDLTGE
ncbi:CsiV family protein [Thalassotalea mangrovi]|nr:CsiV family protein [Thalassotalea mangrovi]